MRTPRARLILIAAIALAGLSKPAAEPAKPAGRAPHWAFVRPQRPPLPESGGRERARNAVDRFVAARLEVESLSPAPEAERTALCRRAALDLTGLPPTPDDVDAFLAERRPDAYERLIDRLLASPAYGERLAARWLEAARYADTSGYQTDGERQMWRWRDWVIDAFNSGAPFDRLTIEQLAGDLLPGATLDQRIATGFNRNHRGNSEGGIIPEEYLAEYVADRVDTTATVWLGLTLACARCHDHKYDPIRQEEFYGVFAFFHNVPEQGKARKLGNSPPAIAAPTREQAEALKGLDRDLAAARERFQRLEPAVEAALAAWAGSIASGSALDLDVVDGRLARLDFEGDSASGLAKGFEVDGEAPAPAPGRLGHAASFAGRGALAANDLGDFGFVDRFSIGAWVRIEAGGGGPLISRIAVPEVDAGYELRIEDGCVKLHLVKRWLDDAIRVETEETLAPGAWHHVMATYDGSRWAAGVRIYVDGAPRRLRVLVDDLNQTFKSTEPFRVGGRGDGARFQGAIDEARLYGRCLDAEEVEVLATAENLGAIALRREGERSGAETRKLRRAFLEAHAPEDLRAAHASLRDLERRRAALLESFPTVMVMEELPSPRPTFVLERGVYDRPGKRVEPGVPACLPPMPSAAPRDRLGLARWLVAPENPLTARVTVNRFWQMLFGSGIVKTVEDFGVQGQPPSHPELLDWLAVELIESGWDLKRLLKTLATSATYRQSSRAAPEAARRDPENRLLARGPRLRLSAEMLRDLALSASGLLVEKLGGPSVKPYQPEGLWKELSGESYVQDRGEDLYRRGIYTYWKRTNAPPSLSILDAPAREACSVRETRTNTPIQALALLNDVAFVEAARVLAQRSIREGGGDAAILGRLFRRVTARSPEARELAVLLDGLGAQRRQFQDDPAAAAALARTGEYPLDPSIDLRELAALTAMANLVLNLDEALCKE
jgi:hypothetical protein